MKRLTTDNPQTNTEALLNFAYAKDGRVYLRYADGEECKDLCEYVAEKAAARGCVLTSQDVMEGACMECECVLAILNVVAIQAAELRHRLMAYEDTGLIPEDLRSTVDIDYVRIVELLKAEAEGRLVVLPCKIGDDMWGLSRYNGHTRRARQGAVTEMYFGDDMSLGIGVKGAGRGIFGKTVFLTREEAEAAIAASKNVESKPVNDLYDEDGGLVGE